MPVPERFVVTALERSAVPALDRFVAAGLHRSAMPTMEALQARALAAGSRRRRPRLARRLRILDVPAAAEGLVELDVRDQAVQANLGLGVLRGVELLLRVEHLEVAGEPVLIPKLRQLDGFLQ